MESLSSRRRRPLKPATIYGWQHCLDRWILPSLANKLVSEVGNGALRQFVEMGFELGELGYKSLAPIRPSLVA
jgi:hypothetical protein